MKPQAEDDYVLRLLHTADWHLGRRFPSFAREEVERKLTRARLSVLERVFGLAERHAVHAVLCAGDLFDDPLPLPEWWEPLVEQLHKRRWQDRPVFLLPGNHDPLLSDSIWARGSKLRAALPSWVHVIDQSPYERSLCDGAAVLYAVPCTSQAGQRDPTEQIPKRAPGDERIRIGLVHGSTFDMPDCQVNFPIARDAAIERGLDYLAIGDTHSFRFVPAERSEPPTLYPGTPEPTAFDEKDAGKVALVYINRRRKVKVDAAPVATWVWEEQHVSSLAALRQLHARSDLDRRVLRLTVEMCLPAPEYEEAERLLDELEGNVARHGRVGVLRLERAGLTLETASIERYCADLPDVLQVAVKRLRDEAATDDPKRAEIARRALFHLYHATRKAS